LDKLTIDQITDEWPRQKCWSSLAHTSISTNWAIDFGKKFKRKKPLRNNKLSDDERIYQGELTLFILSASWRLTQNQQILTSSSDFREYDESQDSFIQSQMSKKIVGESITDLTINEQTLDVSMTLTGNYRIDILCNCPNDVNYVFSKTLIVDGNILTRYFEVRANGEIAYTDNLT